MKQWIPIEENDNRMNSLLVAGIGLNENASDSFCLSFWLMMFECCYWFARWLSSWDLFNENVSSDIRVNYSTDWKPFVVDVVTIQAVVRFSIMLWTHIDHTIYTCTFERWTINRRTITDSTNSIGRPSCLGIISMLKQWMSAMWRNFRH